MGSIFKKTSSGDPSLDSLIGRIAAHEGAWTKQDTNNLLRDLPLLHLREPGIVGLRLSSLCWVTEEALLYDPVRCLIMSCLEMEDALQHHIKSMKVLINLLEAKILQNKEYENIEDTSSSVTNS